MAQQQADLKWQLATIDQRKAESEAQEERIRQREKACTVRELEIESAEAERIRKQETLNEELLTLKNREEALALGERMLQAREEDLIAREGRIILKEQEVEDQKQNQKVVFPTSGQDEETTEQSTRNIDGNDVDKAPEELTAQPVKEEKMSSEREKLDKLLEEDLTTLIKEAEEIELEEPFEEEAVEALRRGARSVAYKKKYYDVFKDQFIYFPSVIKVMVDYTLIEEAEKHYFDEEDEFPLLYSAALRAVAANKLATSNDDTGDDLDEDYMAKLAMDVE